MPCSATANFWPPKNPQNCFFKLALPAVTAQLVNMLYNIVDRMYIGRLEGIGTEALAGCGRLHARDFARQRLCRAGQHGRRAARFHLHGPGRQGERGKDHGQLHDAFALSRRAAHRRAAHLPKAHPFLTFGALPETLPYALEYMNIYAIGTVFVQAALGMNAFITAQGFSRTSMLTVLIGRSTQYRP